MLYHLHELNRTLLNPLVAWSGAAAHALSSPDNWLSRMPGMDRVAAGYELLYRLGKDYEKPAFNITSIRAVFAYPGPCERRRGLRRAQIVMRIQTRSRSRIAMALACLLSFPQPGCEL